MIKSKIAICVLVIVAIFAGMTAFAEPEIATLYLSASADKATEGGFINVDIKVKDLGQAVVKSGSFTLEDLTGDDNAEIGDVSYTGALNITWTKTEGTYNFTIEDPAVLADGTVIGTFKVTFGAFAAEKEVEIVRLATVSLSDNGEEPLPVAAEADETVIKATVSPKTYEAKVTLVKNITGGSTGIVIKITAADDAEKSFEAEYEIKDGYIQVKDKADFFENGKEYSVAVTAAGYTTGTASFTVDQIGRYAFNVENFLPGDVDGNGEINFTDFTRLCSKIYKSAVIDGNLVYDLNKDGSITEADVEFLIAGWVKGGSK